MTHRLNLGAAALLLLLVFAAGWCQAATPRWMITLLEGYAVADAAAREKLRAALARLA